MNNQEFLDVVNAAAAPLLAIDQSAHVTYIGDDEGDNSPLQVRVLNNYFEEVWIQVVDSSELVLVQGAYPLTVESADETDERDTTVYPDCIDCDRCSVLKCDNHPIWDIEADPEEEILI